MNAIDLRHIANMALWAAAWGFTFFWVGSAAYLAFDGVRTWWRKRK